MKKVSYNQAELLVRQSMVFPAEYLERKGVNFVLTNHKGTSDLLEVEYEIAPESVVIRPASLGLSYQLDGNRVTIPMEKPCCFSLEVNGSTEDALLVFVNGEEKLKREDYEHVIYFGPGEHRADIITIEQDNTMVYLEEGAYVHGKILAENKRHIAIGGKGILTMERYERMKPYELLLELNYCKDVEIEGITVTDSCGWTCRIFGCEQVHIDRMKMIGQRGNSDGIDICGSRHVMVEGCFTRVWDDSLVIKAFDTGDLEDVVCKDSVLWNDFARPIEVGVELRADRVNNVHFSNIDIIHSPTGYPLMGIHHGDRAKVTNISFEDIRVEDTPGAQLFDIRITDSVWNDSLSKGEISDVKFHNIFVEKQNCSLSRSRIQGFSPDVKVKNVSLSNIVFDGKAANDLESCGVDVKDFVEGVEITAQPPYLELIETELKQGDFLLGKDGFYQGKVVLSMKNKGEQEQKAEVSVHIAPSYRAKQSFYDICEHLAPGEKKEIPLSISMPPGKYCLHTDSINPGVKVSWTMLDLPMELGEELVEYEFVTCRGQKAGKLGFALKGGLLELRSELLKQQGVVLYGAMPVEMAPDQVLFSVEETDLGKAPAVINGPHGPELAPQLRCPAEISYVFKNEPKVEGIGKWEMYSKLDGVAYVPLQLLGIAPEADEFWLDVSAKSDILTRYPLCMFGSQLPESICHMFVNVKRK